MRRNKTKLPVFDNHKYISDDIVESISLANCNPPLLPVFESIDGKFSPIVARLCSLYKKVVFLRKFSHPIPRKALSVRPSKSTTSDDFFWIC